MLKNLMKLSIIYFFFYNIFYVIEDLYVCYLSLLYYMMYNKTFQSSPTAYFTLYWLQRLANWLTAWMPDKMLFESRQQTDWCDMNADIYVQNIKIIRNNCDMITFLLLRFSLECIHIIFKDTFFYLTLNFNCRKLLFFWLIFFIYIIFSFAWNSMLFNIVKYSFIDYMFYHM